LACNANFFKVLKDGRLKLRDIRTSVSHTLFHDRNVGYEFLACLDGMTPGATATIGIRTNMSGIGGIIGIIMIGIMTGINTLYRIITLLFAGKNVLINLD
jgi:hypothetical protein